MTNNRLEIALTVDVEPNARYIMEKTGDEYSGLTIAMPRVLDVIARHKVPVTWFITHDHWSRIDQEFPLLVEEMCHNGEIGCHVHFRRDKEIYYMDYDFQKEIIEKATYALRKQGFDVGSFRGGNYFFDENTLKVLEELNYKIDSSVIPGLFSLYHGLVINHKKRALAKPYHPSHANHCVPGSSRLLEIPLSVCPYLGFQRSLISATIGRTMFICRPAHSLLKNVVKIEQNAITLMGHLIPIVLSAHPYDFLDNITRHVQNLELFIAAARKELNAEFVTLSQIRKNYTDRKYPFEICDSKFIVTTNDFLGFINHAPLLRKLLKSLFEGA